jgi:DNA-binding CsgD family transcriptional regulator
MLEDMSTRRTSPVLVGRAEQMTALADAFARTREGGQSAVLIGGEAGVGKSRLISEFASAVQSGGSAAGQSGGSASVQSGGAAAGQSGGSASVQSGGAAAGSSDGARVLVGGCLELGADGLPFAPFTGVLRDLVRDLGAEAVASLVPGRGARELARLLPELGDPESGGDPGESRARLFEQVLTLLEHLAAQSPVVLVIEDAHWADRSSRDLIAFLIGNQRVLNGVMIVVTFRSDELHRTHPLRPGLAEIGRIAWVERMELPRLTQRDTGELAARILGSEPGPGLAERLFRRSEGNPLFAEELLSCPDLACDLPESLRDLVLASVQRLPEQTQDVLRVASAGDQASGHALLAAVTGLGFDDLTHALRPAVTANVLLAQGDGYAFRHALIREAVHEDLLPGEHGRIHARFAEAIDADPSLVAPGRAAIETAHHWYSAHDATWGLIASWQAAAQAGKAVAYAERLDLLSRVLELWDQVPDAAERIGADHARVLEEAARTADDAGEDQRGLALVNAAIKELDAATEPVRMALLLETRHQFKDHLGIQGVSEDLDEALRLVPEASKARAAILLSSARCGDARHGPQFKAWAEEALVLARQEGDASTEAHALVVLAMVDADPGGMAAPGSTIMQLIAEARAIAERTGAHTPLMKTIICESHLLEGAGEHELAVEVARQGISSAEKYGLARTRGTFLSINLAEPLASLGRWDEASAVTSRALELSPPPMYRTGLRLGQGFIDVARGDLPAAAEAAAAAAAVLAGARYEDQYHLPLASLEVELRLAQGGPADGIAAAMDVLDRFDLSVSSPRYAWPLLVTEARAALAALWQGAAARTDALTESGTALMERLRMAAEKLETFGPVQQAYQLSFAAQDLTASRILAAAELDVCWGDVVTAWDAATAAWDVVRQPYPAATTLLRAAESALAAGDRDTAAVRLRRAAPLADELGARSLSADIALLARRARISLAPAAATEGAGADAASQGAGARDGGAHAPGPDRLGLTDREFEVLRLVAAGRSNREIAGELFISAKTASVHVSNILGKLNVASRGEAAAEAHRLRLFDPQLRAHLSRYPVIID